MVVGQNVVGAILHNGEVDPCFLLSGITLWDGSSVFIPAPEGGVGR